MAQSRTLDPFQTVNITPETHQSLHENRNGNEILRTCVLHTFNFVVPASVSCANSSWENFILGWSGLFCWMWIRFHFNSVVEKICMLSASKSTSKLFSLLGIWSELYILINQVSSICVQLVSSLFHQMSESNKSWVLCHIVLRLWKQTHDQFDY